MTTSASPPVLVLPAALLSQGFALRPESETDLAFLQELYISTRADEMALAVHWTPEQKHMFLLGQFRAQRHHYRTHFPDCAFEIIEQDAMLAGRLYIDQRSTRLHIIDISLMPDWRGKGLGTQLLQAVQRQAATQGLAVSIMVEKFNPALRLYKRLGFKQVQDFEVYLEMEWAESR